MTVYCWARPRSFPRLPPAESRYFDTAPETRVLAHCFWQPERAARPVLIALHGLEGSSQAHYMRGLADKAFAAGFNADPAEPTQLRRNRGALRGFVSFRVDRGCGRRHP